MKTKLQKVKMVPLYFTPREYVEFERLLTKRKRSKRASSVSEVVLESLRTA